MRIKIKQCKYCIFNIKCNYAAKIRKTIGKEFKGLKSIITCDLYNSIYSMGELVGFDVYSVIEKDDIHGEEYVRTIYGWKHVGKFTGKIISLSKDKLFYIIQIDNPPKVNRIIDGELTEITLEFTRKPINRMWKTDKFIIREKL